MDVASAHRYVSAFGGWVLAPTSDVQGANVTGWSGGSRHDPSSLTLTFALARSDREVEMEIEMRDRPLSPWMTISRLTSREVPRRQIQFPLELRFDREKVKVRVEGRPRMFTLVTCGDWGIATAEIAEVAVRETGARTLFDALSLRKLSEKELATLIKEHRARHRAEAARWKR